MITLIKYNRWTGTYTVYSDNGKCVITKKKSYTMQDFMSAAVGRSEKEFIIYRKKEKAGND